MIGKFITFEGGDGAGKTTQIKLLTEYLSGKGVAFLVTREPGGTKISEKIREILLDRGNKEMDAITEAYLFAASRSSLVKELILPELRQGKAVICDRFFDSSLAYQGFGRGLGAETVLKINEEALRGVSPDITFFIDVPPDLGTKRREAAGEPDRMELSDMEFKEKVYAGYKFISEAERERIITIDGRKSPDEIHSQITAHINALFNFK
ncbi:MAG: dTMP kinase [Lachnospiraceae bacterium]|nr:dTMP kinase [Lachnospiraceae bacterium]